MTKQETNKMADTIERSSGQVPLDTIVSLRCLPCSTCGEKPEVEETEVGFIISCNSCDEKYGQIYGTCYDTFPWDDIEDSVDDWNDSVRSENSWFKEEFRKPIQLKIL